MIRSFYPQRQYLSETSAYAAALVASLLLHAAVLQLLPSDQPPPVRHTIMIDASVEFMLAEDGRGFAPDPAPTGETQPDNDDIQTLTAAPEAIPEKTKPQPAPVKPARKKTVDDRLRQLQRSFLQEDQKRPFGASGAQSGPYIPGMRGGSAIGSYIAMIATKIQKNVNRDLCRNARPEIEFAISLRPDGQLQAPPILLKSSGLASCDDAIERAILQSLPLPVPNDPAAFTELRELNLLFRPHDENFESRD